VCNQDLCLHGCRTACSFHQQTDRLLFHGNKADATAQKLSIQAEEQSGRLTLGDRGGATVHFTLSNCRLSWSTVPEKTVSLLLGKDRYLLFTHYSFCEKFLWLDTK
jgi:hypothetical protein